MTNKKQKPKREEGVCRQGNSQKQHMSQGREEERGEDTRRRKADRQTLKGRGNTRKKTRSKVFLTREPSCISV